MRGTPSRSDHPPMQGTKKLLLLAGAAVSTAALALPADSQAFPSVCVVNLQTKSGNDALHRRLDEGAESSWWDMGQPLCRPPAVL